MSFLKRLVCSMRGFLRSQRQRRCRHRWQPAEQIIRRPGTRPKAAEIIVRCPKCGATRREGIF